MHLDWKGEALIRRVKDICIRELDEGIKTVFEFSQVYVPVDTGALKASGRIKKAKDDNGVITASVVYGSRKVDYAKKVERYDAYIRPALRFNKRQIADRLKGKVKGVL